MERASVISALRSALRRFPWVRFAYLFGSVARGEERPGSDVDVGVHVARDPSANDLLDLADALCRAVGRDDVDVVLLDRLGPAFLKEVLAEGVLLIERDRDERVVWVGRAMSRWYDYQPTYDLWREAFWDEVKRKAELGQASRH